MTASLLAFERVSLVTGSMANPSSPSGTLAKLTVIKSFSLSFFPLAGQMASKEGLSRAALASGVLDGSQKAFISCIQIVRAFKQVQLTIAFSQLFIAKESG